MRKCHWNDPKTIERPSPDVFLELLLRDSRLAREQISTILSICDAQNADDVVEADPIENILSIVHPRAAAICDLRIRPCPDGRYTRIEMIIPYAGANVSRTAHLLKRAYEQMGQLITPRLHRSLTIYERVADRRRIAAAIRRHCLWPYADAPGCETWLRHKPIGRNNPVVIDLLNAKEGPPRMGESPHGSLRLQKVDNIGFTPPSEDRQSSETRTIFRRGSRQDSEPRERC